MRFANARSSSSGWHPASRRPSGNILDSLGLCNRWQPFAALGNLCLPLETIVNGLLVPLGNPLRPMAIFGDPSKPLMPISNFCNTLQRVKCYILTSYSTQT